MRTTPTYCAIQVGDEQQSDLENPNGYTKAWFDAAHAGNYFTDKLLYIEFHVYQRHDRVHQLRRQREPGRHLLGCLSVWNNGGLPKQLAGKGASIPPGGAG